MHRTAFKQCHKHDVWCMLDSIHDQVISLFFENFFIEINVGAVSC